MVQLSAGGVDGLKIGHRAPPVKPKVAQPSWL